LQLSRPWERIEYVNQRGLFDFPPTFSPYILPYSFTYSSSHAIDSSKDRPLCCDFVAGFIVAPAPGEASA
jgi:hypothetical protein